MSPYQPKEPPSMYPYVVQRAGPRGYELYDACMAEFTRLGMTREAAEGYLRLHWDELFGLLAPEGEEDSAEQ